MDNSLPSSKNKGNSAIKQAYTLRKDITSSENEQVEARVEALPDRKPPENHVFGLIVQKIKSSLTSHFKKDTTDY